MLNRILIIQTASIGDVILATPIAEKMHVFYPEAKIDLLIKKGYESLFAAHPFLNEVLTWDKKSRKYRNLFNLLKTIRGNRYDLIVNVQRFAATGFLTVFGGAKETVGFDKNPFSMFFTKKVKHVIGSVKIHEIDRNNALIASYTDDVPAKPRLYPSEKAFENVKQYKIGDYICVAPCSLWFTKQFPEDRWVEFLKSLKKNVNVFLLGSKEDHDLCERIVNQVHKPEIINLSGQLNLLESAALMRDAKMNFVNDSSPMHLASSMNAPTTAIYCSTTTDFGFGPLSDDCVVVETRIKLECRPCGLHGFKECPRKDFKCAYSIDIKELTDRI